MGNTTYCKKREWDTGLKLGRKVCIKSNWMPGSLLTLHSRRPTQPQLPSTGETEPESREPQRKTGVGRAGYERLKIGGLSKSHHTNYGILSPLLLPSCQNLRVLSRETEYFQRIHLHWKLGDSTKRPILCLMALQKTDKHGLYTKIYEINFLVPYP